MKNKRSARSARTTAKNIHISQGGRDLTAQAGLIPVVKFFHKEGIVSKTEQTVDHRRGATGLYDAVDMVILSVVGIVGGARSIRSIVTVWNDRVLSRVAGWLRIPNETTFGRILRTFTQKNINEMESLNHRIRAGIWRKALRSGTSIVGVLHCLVIDVDSTVKTAYGKQQGVSVGYNPHKRGAASYHPLLAFCAETKEILQGWLRDGSAYTSNGVVDPHCHEDKIHAATSRSPSKSDSHSVSWRQWFFCGGFAGFPRRTRPWLSDQGQTQGACLVVGNPKMAKSEGAARLGRV